MDMELRRADVQAIINDDIWDVSVKRIGDTLDDDTVTFTCTGRIVSLGLHGMPNLHNATHFVAEAPNTRILWLLLLPYDAPRVVARDEVTATQRASGYTQHYRVTASFRFATKQEVLMRELQ